MPLETDLERKNKGRRENHLDMKGVLFTFVMGFVFCFVFGGDVSELFALRTIKKQREFIALDQLLTSHVSFYVRRRFCFSGTILDYYTIIIILYLATYILIRCQAFDIIIIIIISIAFFKSRKPRQENSFVHTGIEVGFFFSLYESTIPQRAYIFVSDSASICNH